MNIFQAAFLPRLTFAHLARCAAAILRRSEEAGAASKWSKSFASTLTHTGRVVLTPLRIDRSSRQHWERRSHRTIC